MLNLPEDESDFEIKAKQELRSFFLSLIFLKS